MRGKIVRCAALLGSIVVIVVVAAALARSTDCTAAIAAPVSVNFEELEAGNPFATSGATGILLGGLVVDNLDLIGGLIGVGLAIADACLIT